MHFKSNTQITNKNTIFFFFFDYVGKNLNLVISFFFEMVNPRVKERERQEEEEERKHLKYFLTSINVQNVIMIH